MFNTIARKLLLYAVAAAAVVAAADGGRRQFCRKTFLMRSGGWMLEENFCDG
jgi:hypothetical protein